MDVISCFVWFRRSFFLPRITAGQRRRTLRNVIMKFTKSLKRKNSNTSIFDTRLCFLSFLSVCCENSSGCVLSTVPTTYVCWRSTQICACVSVCLCVYSMIVSASLRSLALLVRYLCVRLCVCALCECLCVSVCVCVVPKKSREILGHLKEGLGFWDREKFASSSTLHTHTHTRPHPTHTDTHTGSCLDHLNFCSLLIM
jgi:hypothetical protein